MALLILFATFGDPLLSDAGMLSARSLSAKSPFVQVVPDGTGPCDGETIERPGDADPGDADPGDADPGDADHWTLANLWIVQDRIVLKRGEGGGVTFKPDPRRAVQSYDHSSRPLFGTQTGYAAKRSTQRYSPPPPLITSREVARESVWRSMYGGRGRYGRWSF